MRTRYICVVSAFCLVNLPSTASSPNYVLINDALEWNNADALCSFSYGTSLASIHNTSQNKEAQSTCTPSSSASECWIGLNDVDTEGTLIWTDGTSFDFGTNTSGGVYPWGANEPNFAVPKEDCTHLMEIKSNRTWNDNECDHTFRSLCNYPSVGVIVDDSLIYLRSVGGYDFLGTMDVLDEIHIEFLFMITNDTSLSLLHIGSFITCTVSQSQFNVSFSTVNHKTISFTSHIPDKFYHFRFSLTQTKAVAWLHDGGPILIYNESNAPSHAIYRNQAVYTGPAQSGWGMLQTLKIRTNNAHIDPFNYLCDYDNRFTAIRGEWEFNTSSCWLLANATNDGPRVWLGDKDASSIAWTDYKIEFVVQLLDGDNSAQVGVLFRALNVSAGGTGGYQYMVDVRQNEGVRLGYFGERWNEVYTYRGLTVAFQKDYRIRVEVFADTVHVFLENKHIFTQSLSYYEIYDHGSIGFRVHRATAIIKSLRIIFPDSNKQITHHPTRSPTVDPTNIPTYPSDMPTKYPNIDPTNIPTNVPTNIPTRIPTTYPTVDPSVVPSIHPSFTPTQTIAIDLTIYSEHMSTSFNHSHTQDVDSKDVSSLFNSDDALYVVAVSVFICVAICLLYVMIRFRKRRRAKPQYAISQMNSQRPQSIEFVQKRPIMDMEESVDGPNLSDPRNGTDMINIDMSKSSNNDRFKQWLTENVRLPQYYDCFIQNGYGSVTRIQTIKDKSALAKLGIDKSGHQVRLLKQIRLLKVEVIQEVGPGSVMDQEHKLLGSGDLELPEMEGNTLHHVWSMPLEQLEEQYRFNSVDDNQSTMDEEMITLA
eukprot:230739_1